MATAPTDPELVDRIVEGVATRVLLGALAIFVPPVGLVVLLFDKPHSEPDRRFRRRWLRVAATLTAFIIFSVIWLALNTLGSTGSAGKPTVSRASGS